MGQWERLCDAPLLHRDYAATYARRSKVTVSYSRRLWDGQWPTIAADSRMREVVLFRAQS